MGRSNGLGAPGPIHPVVARPEEPSTCQEFAAPGPWFSLPDGYPCRGPTHHPPEERGPWGSCCPSHSWSPRTCPPPQPCLLMGHTSFVPSRALTEELVGEGRCWEVACIPASGPEADGQPQWTDSGQHSAGQVASPHGDLRSPIWACCCTPTETSGAQRHPLATKATLVWCRLHLCRCWPHCAAADIIPEASLSGEGQDPLPPGASSGRTTQMAQAMGQIPAVPSALAQVPGLRPHHSPESSPLHTSDGCPGAGGSGWEEPDC